MVRRPAASPISVESIVLCLKVTEANFNSKNVGCVTEENDSNESILPVQKFLYAQIRQNQCTLSL